MSLECNCGSWFTLARYLEPPWYAANDTGPALTAWLAEHQHCDPDRYPAEPKLVYESDGPPSAQVAAYAAKVRAGEIKLGAALAVD